METKAAFEEVLGDFYEEGVPGDVKRRRLETLEKAHSATVVTGMRRTGKTYVMYGRMKELLARGVAKERIVHVNFDDERLKRVRAEDLRQIGAVHAKMFPGAAGEKCWYFLDEIQNVEGWEAYARRLLDSNRVQLWLTGSSAKLLSREIATEMRGRGPEAEVFPLSFAEALEFNGWGDARAGGAMGRVRAGALRHAMERYLEEGGFPDVQGDTGRVRVRVLQEYADAVVYRDVLERHEVSSVMALRYTMGCVFGNFGRKISTRAISRSLKESGVPCNRERIGEYLRWLEDAYLVYPAGVRTDSAAVRQTNPDKYYLADTGLIRAMTPKNDAERGWLLENLVFMELRRGFNRIEYYNTRSGGEVDFFVTDRETKVRRLVQVAWTLGGAEGATRRREVTALKAAMEETGIADGTIVTWDDEEEEAEGLRVVPVWKWALEEAWRREADGGNRSPIPPCRR